MAKTLSTKPEVYVLEEDQGLPENEQTKWHIRPLKWRERAELQDGLIVTEINMVGPKTGGAQAGTMRHLGGTQSRIAIEQGLLEIENLRGPNDEVLEYKKDMPKEKREIILDSLPSRYVDEVASEILKMSGLQKEEEKN